MRDIFIDREYHWQRESSTQAAGEGRDRSRMADFEDRLRKFLAHYDELERNQETEDGFIKEFMVRFR